jgi:hypothetical protein
MATLEVHHGGGRVEFVTLTRDQPVLFGSSAKCNIVLDDPAALPFHGRVRWKGPKFKVDASPEAEFVVVNGRKMVSSSLRQGDEFQVGECRIFLIDASDGLPPEDKTRVQPAPVVGAARPGRPEPSRPARGKSRRRESSLERDDWVEMLERDPAPVEGPALPPAETISRGWGWAAPSRRRQAEKTKGGGWFSAREVAPGQERILSSPLVLGLVTAIAVLVLLGIGLKAIIDRTLATRLYQRAVESLDAGDYRNAIRQFDDYLARELGDEKAASKARVLRALANVRQFTSATGASWSNALEAEYAMVDAVGQEPAYRDSSPDLDDLVLKTGEALADRAKATGDAKALAEAENAAALHARIAGPSAGALLGKTRLPAKLADARAAVRKAAVRTKALAAMDEAIKRGSSSDAYAARDALVGQYGDLAGDRAVVERLGRANELIRQAVTFDTSRRPAQTGPLPDSLGPPTSLVLRSSPMEKPSANGPLVFALTEGFACGLDGASGAPLWQVPVGQASPYPPKAVPGGAAVLAFDARSDELVRLEARTGAVAWRQEIGELVADPPLVLGDQVIQATPSGTVLLIDLPTGEVRGTFNLGLRLTRTPVSDEAGQYLYVLAEQDCLFVLTRDPPGCAAVEYLGHAAGSIACPPARLGRFLVIAENHTPAEGRWRVCVLDEGGARVRTVQQVAVPGWTWDTPASSGSVIWATGDRGGTTAYAVGAYEAPSPFQPLAKLDPESKPLGPSFAVARSERELWIGSGRPVRAELDSRRGKIATAWTLVETGPAVAPIQIAGPLMVLSHQNTEGPGVALWGVEPSSGSVRWRTVLGTPWPSGLAEAPDGPALDALGVDGRAVRLTRDRLASGGFVESPLPRPGGFRLPAGPLARLENDGVTVVVPGPGARHLLVRGGGEGEFRPVELPVPLAATPLFWGRDLLVPGVDGRVSLLDPRTGEPRAEPFAPPFDRARPTRWRAPVRVVGDAVALADEAGRVRLLSRAEGPRPRLVVRAEVSLDQAIVVDPVSTGGAVVVVTADGRARSLSARDLGPTGAWPIEAPLAWPPAAVAGRAFLADSAGGVLAIGPDGQRLWTVPPGDAPAAGPPAVAGDVAWFLDRDGTLRGRSLADGSPRDPIALGILPAGAPRALGDELAIPVAPGTVRPIRPGGRGAGEGREAR